jgi:predicted Holliday junction resolvase-like endonuclease
VSDLATLPPLALLLAGLAIGFLVAWLALLVWKVGYTRDIRRDSVARSRATISGQVHEQLLPYFPDFPFDPKDVRFLGSPVDLVVFDGLSAGALQRIVLVEVKTGGSALTGRERQVRDAVREGLVSWLELRRPG